MDAQQGTYVSPDGRHRWDAAAQRWIAVEAAPPAPGPAPTQNPMETGGWGRPVVSQATRTNPSTSTWNRQPWAPPAPTPARDASPPAAAPPASWGAAPAAPGSTTQPGPWGATPAPWAAPSGPRTQGAARSAPAGAAGAVAAVVGGAGLVIGAFLAWISASAAGVSTSQSGINTPSGDGWFFVVGGLAVVAAALASIAAPKVWQGLVVIAAALATAGMTIFEFTDVHRHISDARAAYGSDVGSYGVGLYLLAIGSALALVGGAAEMLRARRP